MARLKQLRDIECARCPERDLIVHMHHTKYWRGLICDQCLTELIDKETEMTELHPPTESTDHHLTMREAAPDFVAHLTNPPANVQAAIDRLFPYDGGVPNNDTFLTVNGNREELAVVRQIAVLTAARASRGSDESSEAISGLASVVVGLIDELRRARVELEREPVTV